MRSLSFVFVSVRSALHLTLRASALAGVVLFASPVLAAGPDLAPDIEPYGTIALAPGSKFVLTTSVSNKGAESSRTTVHLKSSADATIDPGDADVDKQRLPGMLKAFMGIAEGIEKSFDVEVPKEAGTYYYGVCVKPARDEKLTDNNCTKALTVHVAEGNPTSLPSVGASDEKSPE